MHLDSFGYRILWKLKKFFGFSNCGPRPIVCVKPRKFEVCNKLKENLSESEIQRLNLIVKELEFLSKIFNYIPKEINYEQWRQLLKFCSVKERFEFIQFLKQKELKNVKDKIKKNNEIVKIKNNKTTTKNQMKFLFLESIQEKKWINQLECSRYINSLQRNETPNIIIDCRYLTLHSFRGMNLLLKQLSLLITNNKKKIEPWPLYFVNFKFSEDKFLQNIQKKKLHILEGSSACCAEISSLSYLDLFPDKYAKKRLIYLSPHAKECLKKVESDVSYIIGGIVDRVGEPNIQNKASLNVANQENLLCYRLPINEYVICKSGNQMLTIPSVVNILQSVFMLNGDWKESLERYIPKRKFRSQAEKNIYIFNKYKNLSLYKKEVLRILTKNSPLST